MMQLLKKVPISMIVLSVLTLVLNAQTVRLKLANPSATPRNGEPVVVEWKSLAPYVGSADRDKLRLVDEQHRSLPYQLDDLDGDGTIDEMSFVMDLPAEGTRTFTFTTSMDSLASPIGPLQTDAEDFKRIDGKPRFVDDDDGPGTLRNQNLYPFDGVGWESELIGYRLYLDERNSIDIQGKRNPGLQWMFIGSSGVDYQKDAYWGMDVLHVGPALGVGGFSFWEHDSVCHPYGLERRRTRIIARGPVRAVVRVDYDGWDLGGEKANITSLLMIYAGDRVTEHRLLLRSGSPKTVATGIVRHSPALFAWDSKNGTLSSVGPQSRAGDGLLMALTVAPSTVIRKTRDASQELLLLRLEPGIPLRYLISAYWQGETGRMWNNKDVQNFLNKTTTRLNNAVLVTVKP